VIRTQENVKLLCMRLESQFLVAHTNIHVVLFIFPHPNDKKEAMRDVSGKGKFKISRFQDFKMFYLSHTHTGCAVK